MTYSASGYDDVTQTLVVTDPADTTAPDAPTVGNVTGNSTNGYTVTGTAEPGSTITIKDGSGATVGTGTANETGDYTVTLPGSVGPNAPISVTATDTVGNVSDPTPATTPADPVSPVLVAPTGNLTATTSAVGASDAMATLPATLKDSEGADVPVTAVITNASGTAVTNGSLSAGTYTVTYSASGYDDVTQTLVVTDPADTTAPDAPTVGNVTGNSTNGYTVTGTAEPGSTITIKDGSGATVGTGTANETGDYTVTLPGSVGPNAPISVTATDAAGNVSDPTPATTPADPKAPSDTTAPNPPSVDTVTGNPDTGYTVGGKGEPGSTITIKNPATGEILGTTIVDQDGNYSIKLPMGVKPGTQLSATSTDAAGNVSDPTDFIIPVLTSGMAIGNSGDNMGGKYFSSGKLPATNGADTGWLGVIGTVILSLLGSLLFWRKNKKEDES
ncbi:Ig-like domain-containing protein [Lactococcus lactis]